MNPIEKEYNKRFKDKEQSDIRFDADKLWTSISENIHDKPLVESPKTGGTIAISNGMKWLLLLVFIGSTVLLSTYFINSKKEITQQTNTIETTQNTNSTALNTTANSATNVPVSATEDLKTKNSSTNNVQQNNTTVNQTISTITTKKDVSKNSNTQHVVTNSNITISDRTNKNRQAFESTSSTQQTQIINSTHSTTTQINRVLISPADKPSVSDKSIDTKSISTTDDSKLSKNTLSKQESSMTQQQNQNTVIQALPKTETQNTATDLSNILNQLPTYFNPLISEDELNKDDIPAIDPVDIKTSNRFQWQVDLLTGINFLDFKHRLLEDSMDSSSTDWGNLKNDTENGLLSTNYGLHAALVLNEKWLLGTGVEYNDMWTLFSYESQKDITVLKEDELVQIQINSAQDTVNRIYADTLVNAVETRTIKHYNRYQSISIPFEFGLQQSKNKWTYGLSIAPVLHIHTRQVGKAFNTDTDRVIMEFDSAANTGLFDKKITLGLRASPFISYQLKGRYSLMLKSNLNWQSNRINDAAKVNIFQYNLNIGVGYKL